MLKAPVVIAAHWARFLAALTVFTVFWLAAFGVCVLAPVALIYWATR